MIVLNGFSISNKGDSSVGIISNYWEINGSFIFNDNEELNNFKKRLQNHFSFQSKFVPTIREFNDDDPEDYFIDM